MKTLIDLKQYTPEHDAVMNTSLEIIEGAYGKKYSIKIPHELAEVSYIKSMDGDQPCYSQEVSNKLKGLEVGADSSIADYPRHGDTLRLFYSDLDKANAALYFLKKMKGEA